MAVELSTSLVPEEVVTNLKAWVEEEGSVSAEQRTFWSAVLGAYATDKWYALGIHDAIETGGIYTDQASGFMVLPQVYRMVRANDSRFDWTSVKITTLDPTTGQVGKLSLNVAHHDATERWDGNDARMWHAERWVSTEHGDLSKPRNRYALALKRMLSGRAGFFNIVPDREMRGSEPNDLMTRVLGVVAVEGVEPDSVLTANFTKPEALRDREPRLKPLAP